LLSPPGLASRAYQTDETTLELFLSTGQQAQFRKRIVQNCRRNGPREIALGAVSGVVFQCGISGAFCKSKEQYLRKRARMTEEKILTKHPLGKSGRDISKQKYEEVKRAIIAALQSKELTHTELFNELNKSLRGKFAGNISWYGETVKLDLEARTVIERTASKPQKYRLK
jgi:hypothetical protein